MSHFEPEAIILTYTSSVQGIRLKPDEATRLSLSKEMILENGDQGVFLGYQHNLHCIVRLGIT
jgi:hypothetical protein